VKAERIAKLKVKAIDNWLLALAANANRPKKQKFLQTICSFTKIELPLRPKNRTKAF